MPYSGGWWCFSLTGYQLRDGAFIWESRIKLIRPQLVWRAYGTETFSFTR
jgi:hypothetical protein